MTCSMLGPPPLGGAVVVVVDVDVDVDVEVEVVLVEVVLVEVVLDVVVVEVDVDEGGGAVVVEVPAPGSGSHALSTAAPARANRPRRVAVAPRVARPTSEVAAVLAEVDSVGVRAAVPEGSAGSIPDVSARMARNLRIVCALPASGAADLGLLRQKRRGCLPCGPVDQGRVQWGSRPFQATRRSMADAWSATSTAFANGSSHGTPGGICSAMAAHIGPRSASGSSR